MAYYPDVNPGEPFKPVANLENELRHMANARDGFRGFASAVNMPQNVTVPVFNCTEEVLCANWAVSFAREHQKHRPEETAAVPVKKYTTNSLNWGILTSTLNPGEFGSCIVSGVAVVSANLFLDDVPDRLSPSKDGTYFVPGSDVQCIYSVAEGVQYQNAMILLGGNGGGGDYITATNNTSETIPAYSFVTITPKKEDYSILYISPGVSDPCGFIVKDCAPGATCRVQISGIADCSRVRSWEWPYGESPNFLKAGYSVLLNSTGQSTYNNYFKVVATEYKNIPGGAGYSGGFAITKVKIIDGGNPSSSCAGITDIEDVSSEELEYDFIPGTKIYIRLILAETEGFASYLGHVFEINTYPYDGREPVILLAEISENCSVIQRWTGGQIFWRERFVIPFGRRGSTP